MTNEEKLAQGTVDSLPLGALEVVDVPTVVVVVVVASAFSSFLSRQGHTGVLRDPYTKGSHDLLSKGIYNEAAC